MSREREGVYGCMIDVIVNLNNARYFCSGKGINKKFVDHLFWTSTAWLNLIAPKQKGYIKLRNKFLSEAVVGLLDEIYVLRDERKKLKIEIAALEKELGME